MYIAVFFGWSIAADWKTVQLWDVASGLKIADLVGHTGFVGACGFSPDSTRLATGSLDGTIRVWDVRGRRAALHLVKAVTGEPVHNSVAFAANGRRLVVTESAGGALFDADTGFRVGRGRARHATVAVDGRRFVCEAEDAIEVRDTLSGSTIRSFGVDHASTPISSIDISQDGRRVLAGWQKGPVRVFDMDDGAVPAKLEHPGILTCAFFAEGSDVALVADTSQVACHELPSGRKRWRRPV